MSVSSRLLIAKEGTVEAIAAAVDPRYRALILLLWSTALRWGEAVALRRRSCHVPEGSIEVLERVVETPKGPRFHPVHRDCCWLSVRDGVKEALVEHLGRYVGDGPRAVVFTDAHGRTLVRRRFEAQEWYPALRALGLPGEGLGVDSLSTARLWLDIDEATKLRAGYAAGWRRGGGGGD